MTQGDPAARQTYYIHPYSNLRLSSHAQLGAVHYAAPIKTYKEIEKLRTPELTIDLERSEQWLSLAHEIFDGLLTVRRRHHWWATVGGVCQSAAMLRGMDALMLDMLLKDLHTVHHEPRRLPRWVALVKAARAQVYGASYHPPASVASPKG